MTRTEFTRGSTVFLAVAVAGFLSVRAVDRHHAVDQQAAATDTREAPSTQETACVGKDGTWKNWVWANVPMLSPKCP